MTATRPSPPTPRRPRLFSMELLGFMDSPGLATSWSAIASDIPMDGAQPAGEHPRLADREPSEVGANLLKGDIRWSVLLALVLIGAGIAALGAWVTQRPVADRAAALADVSAAATSLRPAVTELNSINESLTTPEVDLTAANEALNRADALSRRLFTASASLPGAETTSRSQATEASGNALDATRLLREAHAYRAAVLPVLASPVLETDPQLIEIDEAVRQFGAWQTRFDGVRTALPDGFMNKASLELDSISNQLDPMLGAYVDALRADDPASAAEAVANLERRLATAESTLFTALADVQTRVQRHVDSALLSLDLLIG